MPRFARYFIDKALELFEVIGERSAFAMTIGNLSDWYHMIGDKESERRCADQALKLAAELGNEELVCEMRIRMGRLSGGFNMADSLELLKQANREARTGKWHDLELRSEFYLREWEILFEDIQQTDRSLKGLLEIREKNPPPEILCGVDGLIGLAYYQKDKLAESRIAFKNAYRIASKSDLVGHKWEILHLYRSFFPDGVRDFERKRESLMNRIFEELDDSTVSNLKTRLRRRLDLYLSRAVKADKLHTETGRLSRLFHIH